MRTYLCAAKVRLVDCATARIWVARRGGRRLVARMFDEERGAGVRELRLAYHLPPGREMAVAVSVPEADADWLREALTAARRLA